MHTIEINEKTYKVKLLKTDEEQEKGLQGIKELPEDEGALFILDEPQEVSIWMKDTEIPLLIVFIDEDEEVIKVAKGTPMDETGITCEDVKYILEVNENEAIHEGDEVDLNLEEDKEEEDSQKIKEFVVLAEGGDIAMSFNGHAKIFSRPNTKALIKFAKRAEASKSDASYETLGKKLFKFLEIQDSNQKETVEVK